MTQPLMNIEDEPHADPMEAQRLFRIWWDASDAVKETFAGTTEEADAILVETEAFNALVAHIDGTDLDGSSFDPRHSTEGN
jgi:hypothetical protein